MSGRTIGEQELALLRRIFESGDATVGEVAEGFGRERNLARSTVLTMMERLRKKGYLARRLVAGVYRYRARTSSAELHRGLIRRFVETNLGGSLSPFVAYLGEAHEINDRELQELESLVARLHSERKKGGVK